MFSRTAKKILGHRQARLNPTHNYSSTPKKDLPREADVVIIGGGSIGCQTAYHLAKRGVANVVLLERYNLTSGTTWHTAGLLWNLRNSDVDNAIINHTAKVFTGLEAETGISTGWINNGGLFVANNKQRLDEYKRMQTLGRTTGIESIVLSPEETHQMCPLLNVDDIYGCLYSPNDGTIDPSGLCQALSRYCTSKGIQIFEETPVLDILTEEHNNSIKKIKGIQTQNGFIKTENVVNCTGGWANYISNMVGIETPLVVMKHAYVTTDRIEGVQNYPNIRDHDLSIYIKLQGDSLHIGGYESNPIILDKLQEDFAFGLYDLDWDVFGIHLENSIKRMPSLEMAGIKSTVCGPESFTPDHKPIMGEDPRVRGYFHGNGFNSAGMMLGGGCGDQLAAWIIHGRPELDMYSYDIRRFCKETSQHKSWVIERSHEAYAKNYASVFVHDQPLAGRNMKKDPFHDVLEADGCFFEERFGWERPGWFGDGSSPIQEYDFYGSYENNLNRDTKYVYNLEKDYTYDMPLNHKEIGVECSAARNIAALFNMTYFGKFFLTGRDARQAADWIFSQKLDSIPTDKVIYSCMLNSRGKLEADLTVAPMLASPHFGIQFEGEGFYIVTSGGSAGHNWAHMKTAIHSKSFDAQIVDVTRDFGILSLQGPLSREILEIASNNFEDWSNEAFPFSTHKIIDIDGIKVRALRISFVGELGWELHIPNEHCTKIYHILHEVGKKFGMINGGFRAIDALSIEKGYPHWHQEIRMDDSPIEAGLLFTCKLKTDTDFLGRSALEKEKLLGAPIKRKCCFTLDDSPDTYLLGNEAIYRNGEVVGFIRRADFAFHLGCPIAYGYVTNPYKGKVTQKWLREGTFQIDRMGVKHNATFHVKTPFDADNLRIQGIYATSESVSDAKQTYIQA